MKRSSFNVLFFLKKTKLLKNGEASVCMCITVDGTRVENNIRKSIDPSLWSQAKESARGKSRKSCDLNAYIENARIKLHQIFCELEEQNQPITARLLQEIFFGQDKEPEAFSDRTKNRKRSAPSSVPCRSTMTNAVPWSGKTTP